jgi:vacuolar-type H+-ATPase subunit H
MRSDIINEVLTVEDSAQKIINDANAASREMIIQTQAKANTIVRDSLKSIRDENKIELSKSEEEAAKLLEETETTFDSAIEMNDKRLDEIADRIVSLVSKTNLFGAEK